MPFRFDIDVPTAISVRDMWLGQIEKARRYTDATHPIEISVLEVRKCTKRVRALLRLIRPALPKRDWRRENDRWRDLGRALGVLRDHTAIFAALDALDDLDDPQANSGTLEACYAALKEAVDRGASFPISGAEDETVEERRNPAREDRFRGLGEQDLRSAINAELNEAEVALDDVPLDQITRERIGFAYARAYRRGRDEMTNAYRLGQDEMFHDWRKRVQHHWRQSALLRDVWPETMTLRVETARALSKALGRDHDASLLIATVNGLPDDALSADARADIVADARAVQRDLRTRAKPLAYWLYAFEPDEMRTSVVMWWQAALSAKDLDLSDLYGQ